MSGPSAAVAGGLSDPDKDPLFLQASQVATAVVEAAVQRGMTKSDSRIAEDLTRSNLRLVPKQIAVALH